MYFVTQSRAQSKKTAKNGEKLKTESTKWKHVWGMTQADEKTGTPRDTLSNKDGTMAEGREGRIDKAYHSIGYLK